MLMFLSLYSFFFFFIDTSPTEIYTLSLHDALPICCAWLRPTPSSWPNATKENSTNRPTNTSTTRWTAPSGDRKSTRLNSSHTVISYAVFCLKKKKKKKKKQKQKKRQTTTTINKR